jgi:hypothetical protein
MQQHRDSGATLTEVMNRGRLAGSEPGADPRRAWAQSAYSGIHEKCEIEVIDYSNEDVSFRQMDNKQFLQYLEGKEFVRHPSTAVRWINIGVRGPLPDVSLILKRPLGYLVGCAQHPGIALRAPSA